MYHRADHDDHTIAGIDKTYTWDTLRCCYLLEMKESTLPSIGKKKKKQLCWRVYLLQFVLSV